MDQVLKEARRIPEQILGKVSIAVSIDTDTKHNKVTHDVEVRFSLFFFVTNFSPYLNGPHYKWKYFFQWFVVH